MLQNELGESSEKLISSISATLAKISMFALVVNEIWKSIKSRYHLIGSNFNQYDQLSLFTAGCWEPLVVLIRCIIIQDAYPQSSYFVCDRIIKSCSTLS